MPPPPPLPGETSSKRRLTRSTTRAGRGVPSDTPATPITPSCPVAPNQRTGLRPPAASAMASPNPFTPHGEDEFSNPREDAEATAPPQGSPVPRAPAHGWDSFVHSLDETAQRELGVVDDIRASWSESLSLNNEVNNCPCPLRSSPYKLS